VRAADRQLVGKFYWECTFNTVASVTTGVGVHVSSFAFGGGGYATGGAVGTCGVVQTGGNVYLDGTHAGLPSLGALSAGNVICIAVDCTARLIWFRLGAAGNWNASAPANPATGVGGISIINFGVGIPLHPSAVFTTPSDSVTANFGDTAFVGAVPSGYTSGFPSPSSTVLLVHADGANGSTTFTDSSAYARTLNISAAPGPFVSTTSPKFGAGSADFTVNGNTFINAGVSADFNLGARQFTVEAWAYFTSAPGATICGILSQFGGTTDLGWFFGMVSGSLAFYYSTTGTDNPNVGAAYVPTTNTWIHLAADRDAANVLRVYANGAVIASSTVASTIFASTRNLYIGNDMGQARTFPGKLDEIRITNGLARYGGAFTAPTAPFVPEPAIPTNALASQVAAEHWLTTNPAAQITQVAVEHWQSVTSDNLQAIVTFVAVEHWMSVASVSPAAGGPIVTMIH
jgi:hypothetical protein